MSQNYIIKDVKKGSVSKDSYGEYQNYALAVQGIGEPVKYSLHIDKPAPKAGDNLYGSLEELDIKGRTYYKLRTEAKPAPSPMTTQEAIMSQWAIGRAIDIWIAQGCLLEAYDNIQTEAQHFYEMIDTIRGDE